MGSHLRTAVVSALIGACAATATIAVAGTGVGGVFNLGQTNSVDAPTKLQGSSGTGAQLAITNTNATGAAYGLNVSSNSATAAAIQGTNNAGGTGLQANSTTGLGVLAQTGSANFPALRATNTGGFPAASFVTSAGVAPFRVNSSQMVGGLNADMVDGLDASQLTTHAYSADGSVSTDGQHSVDVAVLTGLPAATYIVWATGVDDTLGSGDGMNCWLGDTERGSNLAGPFGASNYGNVFATATLELLYTVPDGGSIHLSCQASGTLAGHLVALKVNASN
jgi:hypothetical protein